MAIRKFKYYPQGYSYSGRKGGTPPEEILDREIDRFRKMIPKNAFDDEDAFKDWYNRYFSGTAQGNTFMKKVPQKTFWDYLKKEQVTPSRYDTQVVRHSRTNLTTKKFVKSYLKRKPKAFTDPQIREFRRFIKKQPDRIPKKSYNQFRLKFNEKFEDNRRISSVQSKIRRLKKEME